MGSLTVLFPRVPKGRSSARPQAQPLRWKYVGEVTATITRIEIPRECLNSVAKLQRSRSENIILG